MLFNSIDFAIFLPAVFILYWFVCNKSLKLQNILVVGASYLFYGWWDWRFLSLIIFSTLVDYLIGVGLSKEEDKFKRKVLLWLSIGVNLGFLGFFKYYNFFLDNFVSAFSFFGTEMNTSGLNIILPVGISFYTFQTMSYSIDVYRRKIEPTKDFISFAAFVAFFPQLVAGPIEQAKNLLPQFYKQRTFEYDKAVDGLRQILWGLFKKVVIADQCAEFANIIFNNSDNYSGSTILLGVLFFTFQIYGDFSGYSDIAIGVSRLFGINLMQNFAFPYFSRDIGEFWRRWHISLSSWFKEYVYIPLGGSRDGTWIMIRNTFIIFLVSGFWHGANWTFIVWGALNAIYFLPLVFANKNRQNLEVVAQGKLLPTIREIVGMVLTFGLTVFAWIFFRAESLTHAFSIVKTIFSKSLFSIPYWSGSRMDAVITLCFIGVLMLVEWLGRENQYGLAKLGLQWKRSVRLALYCIICLIILSFIGRTQEQFIYFQF